MRETVLRLVRFFISGATGAVVHIGVLTFLVELAQLHPVPASAGGFIVAFGISFTLQKYWTFKNNQEGAAGRQMAIYFGIQVMNLLLNMLAMYVFVEIFRFQYQISQILVIGAIAIEAYVLYKKFVFITATAV